MQTEVGMGSGDWFVLGYFVGVWLSVAAFTYACPAMRSLIRMMPREILRRLNEWAERQRGDDADD